MSTDEIDRQLPSHRLAEALPALLASSPVRDARRAAGEQPLHLVGGALRDLALGTPVRDWDLVVAGDGAAVAERLGHEMDARLIHLGQGRWEAYRLVTRSAIVDVWDRGDASLTADLERRDLSLHALALDLRAGDLHDPCGGLADLDARRLRAPRPDAAFREDPQRVARLARFHALLTGFEVESTTAERARVSAPQLATVAPERVRTELELALAATSASRLFEALTTAGLVPGPLFDPEPGTAPHETFALLERAVPAVIAHDAPPPRDRPELDRVALHLAALAASSVGRENAIQGLAARRWVTRRRAQRAARLLTAEGPPDDDAGRRWWLHEAGDLWPSAAALWGALLRSPDLAAALAALARRHHRALFAEPAWIDGRDMRRLSGLPPGPELGNWLRRARRWQVDGSVKDAAGLRRRIVRELGTDGRNRPSE